jgi:hypothetical protein
MFFGLNSMKVSYLRFLIQIVKLSRVLNQEMHKQQNQKVRCCFIELVNSVDSMLLCFFLKN